jgi:hypothetical protein
MAEIEKHPHWLARSLDEDFGVDCEAEYIPIEARGDVLKLQFKTTRKTTIRSGRVRFSVDRKYLEYAWNCRYPVVFILIDIERENAWYLWLQDWIFKNQCHESISDRKSSSTTIWVEANFTLSFGLDGELRTIAQWRGPTQLALSLLDAFRAAIAVHNQDVLSVLTDLLEKVAPALPDSAINDVIQQAIRLGNRLWGTPAGNTVAAQLYRLVRRFGDRMMLGSIDAMVIRGDTYSRTGVNALGILYDDHSEHARSLNLVGHFMQKDLASVAYLCALREAYPQKNGIECMNVLAGFEYGGVRFRFDDDNAPTGFLDKFANRGISAILDYLVLEDSQAGPESKNLGA